ncbi:acetyl-CoA C-acyltransferase [Streptomyces sp. DSM 116496]|uniref:acetyl-CoA C-acyltransferase n=1 Tax=Streptomyces stoeckheimensis TaxID=3344656 RepID=UPI0038B279E2
MTTTEPRPVIVSAVRTPIGRAHRGALASVRPDDLLATAVEAALARVPQLDPAHLDDLIAGCALPGGEQGFNIARITAVLLGLDHVPGATVNRFCTSSLQALRMAAQAVRCGDARAVVAAGVESQSRLAYGSSDTWPGTRNPAFADAEARTAHRSATADETWYEPRTGGALPDPYLPVALAAEHAADVYGITRTEMDAYAVRSHRLAGHAWETGFFTPEIVPVLTPAGEKVTRDDCPRRGVTLDTLAALAPAARPDGRVTAGNAAPLSDGAAAVLVMDEAFALALGITPLARILATAVSAHTPETEGPAPVEATRRVLARTGMTLDDVDVCVGNEPFAAQMLAYCRELDCDPDRFNTRGGSIALGEPYGAAGARLTTTALNTLRQDDSSTALISVVAAGGIGMTAVLERLA